jgi:hypothetical protein
MRDEKIIRDLLRWSGQTEVKNGRLGSDVYIYDMMTGGAVPIHAVLRREADRLIVELPNHVSISVQIDDLLDIAETEH